MVHGNGPFEGELDGVCLGSICKEKAKCHHRCIWFNKLRMLPESDYDRGYSTFVDCSQLAFSAGDTNFSDLVI